MKKRIFTAVLALCMVAACFAGCAASESSIRGNVTPDKKEEQTVPTQGETVPETTETVPETTAGAEISLGSTSGNRWENEFIGIGCQLDENWTFMTDEEIRQQNQISTELVGDDYKEALESAAVIYDMMANHANGTSTIGVNLEKLSGANLLITEQLYIEVSRDNLEGAIASMGVENIQVSTEEISFGGKTHYGVRLEGEYSGVKIYETLIAVKCNGYMACVTACTWVEDGTQEILDCFYGL